MQIQTQLCTPCCAPVSRTAVFSRKPVGLITNKNSNWRVSFLSRDLRRNLWHWRKKNEYAIISAVEEGNLGAHVQRKRGVVEHICLIRAKEDLSEEQEKDMLDYLYTTQYQMRGIIAISLGRISNQGLEKYTHAIFMRFRTKEDIAKFYENPFYMGVLKDHVMPYCHGLVDVDYESEVEDDILPIFRKGEEFNYGIESVLLISFIKSSLGQPAQAALDALAKLTLEFPSLIVQATKGPNINLSSMEYTHWGSNTISFTRGLRDICEQFRIQRYVEIKFSAHHPKSFLCQFFRRSSWQGAYVTRTWRHHLSRLSQHGGFVFIQILLASSPISGNCTQWITEWSLSWLHPYADLTELGNRLDLEEFYSLKHCLQDSFSSS
ncbi:Stress responsive alpha-beta barrel domain protein [Abeliophyllum distichum]|uniref:Stress responsive alpha-beta barrel domain protein n=1 Tax=Abeliophyllum distichum TaxID=126358 RepID=A0ABD1TWG8_9LAMI